MKQYHWRGLNKYGVEISGSYHATTKASLKKLLLERNIYPLSINPVLDAYRWQLGRIKLSEISRFIEQLAILINAQVNLLKALELIANKTSNRKLRTLITSLKNSIIHGNSLQAACRIYPKYFDDFICSFIHIGEETGALDIVLQELATHLKKRNQQRQRLMQAAIYPITVIVIGLMVGVIFLTVILPEFETIFTGANSSLPVYTQLLITFSHGVRKFWLPVTITLIVVIIILYWWYQHSQQLRLHFDRLLLKIPILGSLIQYAHLAHCAKICHLMLKAGITLPKAITIASQALVNQGYRNSLQKLLIAITEGSSLGEAMAKQTLFPEEMIQLVIVGEETGSLEIELARIATLYEDQLLDKLEKLNRLLEPLIITFLGLLVGGLLIGIYLPIFQLGATI